VHEETREELILIEFRSFFVLYNLKNKETTKHFYPSFGWCLEYVKKA